MVSLRTPMINWSARQHMKGYFGHKSFCYPYAGGTRDRWFMYTMGTRNTLFTYARGTHNTMLRVTQNYGKMFLSFQSSTMYLLGLLKRNKLLRVPLVYLNDANKVLYVPLGYVPYLNDLLKMDAFLQRTCNKLKYNPASP